jgi:hypothetical protein
MQPLDLRKIDGPSKLIRSMAGALGMLLFIETPEFNKTWHADMWNNWGVKKEDICSKNGQIHCLLCFVEERQKKQR